VTDRTQRDITDRPITVIGAGTLGRRIALMFATQGGEVRVFDTSSEQQADALAFIERELPALVEGVSEASAGRVAASEDLAQAVSEAWLVVEALPERLDVKEQIFGELDELAPPDAVLATNSSSYPSSQMIGRVSKPERVVNTHFYMPPISNAVEIMSCGVTDRSVIDLLIGALPPYGLVPFEVRKESVGFIYNRIWAAIKRESLAVAAEGVATPDEIDGIFQVSLGAPYGPFRAMDLVGLDVVLDIEEHYATARDGIPEAPRRLLREYIDDGRLGVKSGRGFYNDYGSSAEQD
jgi:3-hydroxybutyryl-CoA dehydrogenase